MNKPPLVTRAAEQAWILTLTCILAFVVIVVLLWGIHAYKNYMKFSPSSEPGAAGSTSVAPVQYKVKARMEQK